MRRAEVSGFESADVRSLAGLLGLCVKGAYEAGATEDEVLAAVEEVIDESDQDAVLCADGVISPFIPLGVDTQALRAGNKSRQASTC